jgi:chromosome segregation ATPase
MSDWDKPTEDMVDEMLDRKTLIKTQAKEIEKLQAENAKFAASNHAYLSDYQEARGEIEKLRAALREIKRRTQDAHPMSYVADYWRIANDALGEKE